MWCELLLGAGVALLGAALACWRRSGYWKRRGVEEVWWGRSLWGAAVKGVIGSLQEAYASYPGAPYFGVYLVTRPVLVLRDLSLVQDLMVKDFDSFDSHGFYVDQVRDLGAGNIFFTRGSQWRSLRSRMTPFFSPAKVKAMFPQVKSSCESLLRYMKGRALKGPIELRNIMVRYSIEVVMTSSYGVKPDTLEAEKSTVLEVQQSVFSWTFLARRMVGLLSRRLYRLLGLSVFGQKANTFFLDLVQHAPGLRSQPRQDYFQALLDLVRSDQPPRGPTSKFPDGTYIPWFTEESLACHVMTLFAGGTESSGTTLAFCLQELAFDQDIQDKARTEVLRFLEENLEQSYESLQSLPYLNSVLQETLRKYPSFHTIYRECTKDTVLRDGLKVEAGTLVCVPVYALHHDPVFFPDPESFRPERPTHASYLAFGTGPRACVGIKLAMSEMLMALVEVLSQFRFTPCSESRLPVELGHMDFLTAPRSGIWLNAVPLDS